MAESRLRSLVSAWRTRISIAVFVLLLVAVAWLVREEVNKGWIAFDEFTFRFSPAELLLGLSLGIFAFLCETRAWQRALNGHLGRTELTLAESVAMFNTSGLLRYVPGRIWTFGAQMLWLGHRGIKKTLVAQVNALCIMCSTLVSAGLGGAYLIVHFGSPNRAAELWTALALLLAIGFLAGPRLLSLGLGQARRLFKGETGIVETRPALTLEIGVLVAASWGIMGVSGYYAAQGIGLDVKPSDVVTITASMAVGWIVGYVSVLTPGGLGVREALMFVMLKGVSSSEIAVLLPVLTRLLFVVAEVSLGAAGVVIGFRRKLFAPSSERADATNRATPS